MGAIGGRREQKLPSRNFNESGARNKKQKNSSSDRTWSSVEFGPDSPTREAEPSSRVSSFRGFQSFLLSIVKIQRMKRKIDADRYGFTPYDRAGNAQQRSKNQKSKTEATGSTAGLPALRPTKQEAAQVAN